MRILVLDNYDSFTWNLCHLIAEVNGHLPEVRRNDEIDLEGIRELAPDAVVISPGPGHPARKRDFGVCSTLLTEAAIPVLGVCLGHQGIAHFSGGKVELANKPMHGLASRIGHCGAGLFAGIPQNFEAVRYHSHIVVPPLPPDLEALAWTSDGEIMAIRHKWKPFWGMQFHPESIGTEYGARLLRNFLDEVASQSAAQVRRLDAPFDPEQIFTQMFAGDDYSFWLDNSAGGGHSYVGGSSIPGSYLVTHQTPGNLFSSLRQQLSATRRSSTADGFVGGFVGYFGFEMKRDLGLPCAHRSQLPDVQLLFTPAVVRFDHGARTVELAVVGDGPALADWADRFANSLHSLKTSAPSAVPLPRCQGRLTPERYRERVAEAKHEIAHGESYEVCLTDILTGPPIADPLSYYRHLRQRNPAPYSAFLKLKGVAVACSSPERFLRIDRNRTISSKPIKGTAPRSADPADLLASTKDSAEHLMIVDLVRHDLGRVCQPRSVHVTAFREIESYASVHQMVSTIAGTLRPDCDVFDAFAAAFPPGSMTGAPKQRTLEILDRLEAGPRGIYSGSIGWIGVNGCCDLNVVIRTAVFTDGATEIGSGGAIVAMSEPDGELDELRLKIALLAEAG